MNAIVIRRRKRTGIASDHPKPDKPLDAAWMVLEAANDLGDHATVEVCRRVIDANLNGRACRRRPTCTSSANISGNLYRVIARPAGKSRRRRRSAG